MFLYYPPLLHKDSQWDAKFSSCTTYDQARVNSHPQVESKKCSVESFGGVKQSTRRIANSLIMEGSVVSALVQNIQAWLSQYFACLYDFTCLSFALIF